MSEIAQPAPKYKGFIQPFLTRFPKMQTQSGQVWNVPIPSNYVNAGTIGMGGQGVVLKLTHKATGKPCCLKCVSLADESAAKHAVLEMGMLRKLKHPNIVRCVAATTHLNFALIQMEYAAGGDLYGLVKKTGLPLDEFCARDVLVQICLAMAHLQRQRIMHRDVKPQNILVQRCGQGVLYKLSDFGLSRELTHTSALASTRLGTPYYMSPECLMGLPYGARSDIYSLGVTLYYCISRRLPYKAESTEQLLQAMKSSSAPRIPVEMGYSTELVDTIMQMISFSSMDRPQAVEILANAYFAEDMARNRQFYKENKFEEVFEELDSQLGTDQYAAYCNQENQQVTQ